MKVTSSAALGTLTVSEQDLNEDPLLRLIVKAASPLQLTVSKSKKATLSLELLSGTKLLQRNAIIRCLSGMGLHNALDGSPYYLLGGHSAAVNASPTHSMAIAAISSWMSVADHARTEDSLEPLLMQIETHLETRSFLTPSASMTAADIDVASLLLKKGSTDIVSYPNIHRWVLEVSSSMKEFGVSLPGNLEAIPDSHSTPIFFYGTEDVDIPKKSKVSESKVQESPHKGKEGKQGEKQPEKSKAEQKGPKEKQQQQQQEQSSFDVSALDIRVGKILKVWPHPEAEKLFCEEIDVGEESSRQIASGLRPFYKQEELEGRRVIVLCNLKKRNLVGFPSHGMVMCASNADHSKVECMEPPPNAKIGERVEFEGFNGEPEPENKVAKKKIFEAVSPYLKTNSEGVCVWKGAMSKTSDGPIKACNGMSDAHVA